MEKCHKIVEKEWKMITEHYEPGYAVYLAWEWEQESKNQEDKTQPDKNVDKCK
jgi:hypothetical protein